jgi:hypothetical protein
LSEERSEDIRDSAGVKSTRLDRRANPHFSPRMKTLLLVATAAFAGVVFWNQKPPLAPVAAQPARAPDPTPPQPQAAPPVAQKETEKVEPARPRQRRISYLPGVGYIEHDSRSSAMQSIGGGGGGGPRPTPTPTAWDRAKEARGFK